jgi:hypothetical protein
MEITDIINDCIGSDSNQSRLMPGDKADKQELHYGDSGDKLPMVSDIQYKWDGDIEHEPDGIQWEHLFIKFYRGERKLCH